MLQQLPKPIGYQGFGSRVSENHTSNQRAKEEGPNISVAKLADVLRGQKTQENGSLQSLPIFGLITSKPIEFWRWLTFCLHSVRHVKNEK